MPGLVVQRGEAALHETHRGEASLHETIVYPAVVNGENLTGDPSLQ